MAFILAPIKMVNPIEWCRRIALVVNGIMQGKTNNIGTLTLTANSATTTITFAAGQIGEETVITLTATTANAAGAVSSLYLSSRNVANSTLTFTHANTATNDRTFLYELTG